MADSTPPLATWTVNTESDLAGYSILYTQASSNVSGYGYIKSITNPATVSYQFVMNDFFQDGLWKFSINASDTTGNVSGSATPVFRRVIRTASVLRLRR